MPQRFLADLALLGLMFLLYEGYSGHPVEMQANYR